MNFHFRWYLSRRPTWHTNFDFWYWFVCENLLFVPPIQKSTNKSFLNLFFELWLHVQQPVHLHHEFSVLVYGDGSCTLGDWLGNIWLQHCGKWNSNKALYHRYGIHSFPIVFFVLVLVLVWTRLDLNCVTSPVSVYKESESTQLEGY